jgi:dihydrofolate reductase
MKISIIAAMDSKKGIGKEHKIPWHIVGDLVHLKALTKDQTIILGRKTYDSMAWYYDRSGRPMPGKLYIVVTRDGEYKPTRENATVVHSLNEALSEAEEVFGSDEVFISGGGQIFTEAMEKNLADKLYLTVVDGDFNCDTFFPDYPSFTKVISAEDREENGLKYKFLTLEK